MISAIRSLFRYRALISSLVARELKARYRGSVLGFLWTFANPLLLLGPPEDEYGGPFCWQTKAR